MPYYYKREEHGNMIQITRSCSNCDSEVRSYQTICLICNEDITQPIQSELKDSGDSNE